MKAKHIRILIWMVFTALWVISYLFIIKPIDTTGLGLGLLCGSYILYIFTTFSDVIFG